MRAKVKAFLSWMGRAIALVWLLSVTHSAVAETFNPKEMLTYRPFGNGEAFLRFAADDTPTTISELGPFAVVNYGKATRCPAGGFYIPPAFPYGNNRHLSTGSAYAGMIP